MQIPKIACTLRKQTINLLTVSHYYAHNSLNTPAKPMLFSNSMLKLSGLFFARYISKVSRTSKTKLSVFNTFYLLATLFDEVAT